MSSFFHVATVKIRFRIQWKWATSGPSQSQQSAVRKRRPLGRTSRASASTKYFRQSTCSMVEMQVMTGTGAYVNCSTETLTFGSMISA